MDVGVCVYMGKSYQTIVQKALYDAIKLKAAPNSASQAQPATRKIERHHSHIQTSANIENERNSEI